MKYLSIDIEATGLKENSLIIEFAMIPFDTRTKTLEHPLAQHFYIQCPSFEDLKPTLDPWVIDHNKNLIEKAHQQGLPMPTFKLAMQNYLTSMPVQNYFSKQKITLFGKSMNAIDLPFLNRDLGWDFMRDYFNHKVMDLSCFAFGLIDMGILATGQDSTSNLMRFLKMGDVAHTALEDAVNTAKMYLQLLEISKGTQKIAL